MSSLREEILALEEQIRFADASPDPDTSPILEKLLADDVVMIGPKGEMISKAFVLAGHRPPIKQQFSRMDVSEMVIKDLGDSALVTCRGKFVLGEKTFELRFLRVWQKQSGQWKVVAGSVTGII
jgi:hypothetical protein